MNRTLLLLLPLLFATTALYGQKGKENRIIVIADNPGAVVCKDIYGHFSEHLGSCIYGGLWVGDNPDIPNINGIRLDVLNALREIKIPNLRWPGGCFADTYHWRDGIGPQNKRASIVNIHWGGITEDNSFGTHEFMELTGLLGCDAYINGNLGSGTVQEMAEWVEYLTSANISPATQLRKQNGREGPWKVKYFAIGNENWGCGGSMTAEHYADLMRQYSTYLRDYNDNHLYRIACGPSDYNFQWTETLMKDPGTRSMFEGLSVHYYTVVNGWSRKSSATLFGEYEWFETFRLNLEMDNILRKHEAVMDLYDPGKTKGLIVDEWGNWYNVEPGTNPGFLYQQNTLRDAITAAIHLNIFNNHAERVKMANLAQVANVLQSVVLTKEDKMILTPTWYVFRMYAVHQNARLLPLDVKCEDYVFKDKRIPSVSASATMNEDGTIHLSLANLTPDNNLEIECLLAGCTAGKITAEILTAPEMNSYNSFEDPWAVKTVPFSAFTIDDGILSLTLPSKSVLMIEIKTKE